MTNQSGGGLSKLIAIGFGAWAGTKLVEGATGRSVWDLVHELAEARR